LAAARDIALTAGQDTTNRDSANHSSSASIGVGFALGGEQNGFTIELAAAAARGKGNGDSTTHHVTSVNAGDVLSLSSGRDTTLEGAQAYGNTILADIGRSLTLTSTQDTDHYQETYQSASAGLSLCIPPICYGATSGGASYSQSNISNNYQSVTEQTGLAAGSGGFDIHVGDTTTLTGAAIASTADPSKNFLDTGSLVVNDLHNSAHSSASQMGFSYSSSSSAGSNLANNAMGAALNMAIPQGGSDSSDTQSSIAQGTIIVRDHPDQDLSGIDRGATTLDGNGVSNDFDVDEIKENQALGQAAGYVGMRAAGDLADLMADHASTEQEQKAWQDGGIYRVLLHGLVGAATAELGGGNATQGALGAVASEVASGAMANYLADHGIDPNGAEGKTLMQLASAAVGGAVGGGAGAVTALDGEKYNRQLHPSERQLAQSLAAKSNGRYTVQQIEDAMRLSGYSLGQGSVMPGETALTGSLVKVEAGNGDAIYDTGASWVLVQGPNGSQYLAQQVPEQVSPELAAYITDNTGGTDSPYAWAREQQGMAPGAVAVGELQDWVSDNRLGSRTLGGLQMVGGALEFTGGVFAAATCGTGFGCAASMYLTGAGFDNAMAGSSTLVNGPYTATLGEQGLQWVGLSPKAASLVYGISQMVPAGVEGYAINVAADAQAAANAAARQSYIPISNFNPLGVKITPEVMQTPQAKALLQQYLSAGIPASDAEYFAGTLISSGTKLPETYPVGSNTVLVKLVPKTSYGSDPITPKSPVFVTRVEYNSMQGMSSSQMADYLGIPAEQGVRGSVYGFDAFAMTPKPGATPVVFSSEVAPIVQGAYSARGGAQQNLVPNRLMWTDPNTKKIGPIGGGR
jgi:filamentous hemagglutinin